LAKKYPIGIAIAEAIIISLKKSLCSINTILVPVAPKTFLIPISFFLLPMVKVVKLKSPMQEIIMLRKVAALIN
jgi:hypothetical protein